LTVRFDDSIPRIISTFENKQFIIMDRNSGRNNGQIKFQFFTLSLLICIQY